LDYLLALLGNLIEDPERVRLVFIGLVTLAFFGLSMALTLLVSATTDPLRRRLQRHAGEKRGEKSFGERLADAMRPVARYVLPSKEAEVSQVRTQLIHAGYRGQNTLMVYYATKTSLAIVMPAIVLAVAPFFPAVDTRIVLFFTMAASFVGLMAPNVLLDHAVTKRKKLLRNGFPDALDLLVVCVESGLALATAIQRVSDELAVSHPELAEELALVNAQVRAGVDRVEALKQLSQRTGLDDIRGLVALLSQSMRFGTSIADTLRIYSEEFRDKRMQAAEEQAAKIGTKLIFPLVTCLFPSFFIVAVGPAILKVLIAVGRL
jgi:tight adherence protein C